MRTLFISLMCALPLALQAQTQSYTLKSCLETGLENNYSLRIVRNEEQIEKNNATRGNAGMLPNIDLSAGYNGNVDNTKTIERDTGSKHHDNGVFDQDVNVGINLDWTLFNGFELLTNYERLQEMAKQGETLTRIAIEDYIAELSAEYFNFIQQKIRLKNFLYSRISFRKNGYVSLRKDTR